MSGHDMIVVGASAGGVEAIGILTENLPAKLDAAILFVIHMTDDYPSILADLLNRHSALPVKEAVDNEPIKKGHVYVACPGRHLVVERDKMRVVYGPRENGARPSIDALFRSAAAAYGPAAIGVILTGTLDDGTAGLYSIKKQGGIAVVQDPKDAMFRSMPLSAIENVSVDYVLPLKEIPALLGRLASEPVEVAAAYPVSDRIRIETGIPLKGGGTLEEMNQIGAVSGLTCPECHGALWQMEDGKIMRFRCQTGHAFSIDALEQNQSQDIEAVLWAAMRALEEKAELCRRISKRNRRNNSEVTATKYEESALAAESHAAALRRILADYGGGK